MKRQFLIGLLLTTAIFLTACKVDQGGTASSSTDNGGASNPAGNNPAANSQGQNPADQNGSAQPGPTLPAEQRQALQQFNQLTVGILYLQDNQAGSITKDQATKLLAYYQDVQSSLQQAPAGSNNGNPPAGGGPGGTGIPAGGTPPGGAPAGGAASSGTPQAGGPGRGGPGGFGGFGMFANMDLTKLQADLTGIQSTLTADQMTTINGLTQDQLTATMEQHGIAQRGAQPGGGQPQGTPDPNQMATFQAQGGPGQRQAGSPLLDEVIKVLTTIAGN